MNGDEEDVLRENLKVRALSPQALERIRRATEAEWRAQVGPPRRRGLPMAAAAAVAALAIAAAGIFLVRGTPAEYGESLAQVVRADSPGLVEMRPLWREAAVATGGEVRAGQQVAARGSALLALRGGGNLRLAPRTEIAAVSPTAVRLLRGELYVDIPPGSRASASFAVLTSAGEFRHVGTQFALAVLDGATRLRVREGSVRWQTAVGESMVDAGTEVFIDRDLQPSRRGMEVAGPAWAWAESMAPEIEIEGRPLAEFLDWVARETGRKLVIADESSRSQLTTIRMHGNIHGLEPLQALKAVMASTSLRLDLPAGAIRVSFAGAPTAQQN